MGAEALPAAVQELPFVVATSIFIEVAAYFLPRHRSPARIRSVWMPLMELGEPPNQRGSGLPGSTSHYGSHSGSTGNMVLLSFSR